MPCSSMILRTASLPKRLAIILISQLDQQPIRSGRTVRRGRMAFIEMVELVRTGRGSVILASLKLLRSAARLTVHEYNVCTEY